MKRQEIKELHSKSIKELERLIRKAKEELVKLKLDFGAGRLRDFQAIGKKRREIARLKTILREKELEG